MRKNKRLLDARGLDRAYVSLARPVTGSAGLLLSKPGQAQARQKCCHMACTLKLCFQRLCCRSALHWQWSASLRRCVRITAQSSCCHPSYRPRPGTRELPQTCPWRALPPSLTVTHLHGSDLAVLLCWYLALHVALSCRGVGYGHLLAEQLPCMGSRALVLLFLVQSCHAITPFIS